MKNLLSSPTAHATIAVSLPLRAKSKRIESIDLLRGIVMVIMALDHVRDYFHYDAFYYSPTDLSQTTPILFFTRWITHFCAPIFILLAGVSASLQGMRKTKKELSIHLFTRGLWLIFLELFVLGFFRTFNLAFPYYTLQVIAAIGICMIALSVIIYFNRYIVLAIAILLVAAHNLLDGIHVSGNSLPAFAWSLAHDANYFSFAGARFYVHYPVLPWIGLMTAGYYLGRVYHPNYDGVKRRRLLMFAGIASIAVFIILRAGNFYGDPSHWMVQRNFLFSVLSFVNVTKYPPSLLYILMTIGPALIFLSVSEKPLAGFAKGMVSFGRVAMFYYLAHILLIHVMAVFGAHFLGYEWGDMILSSSVNNAPQLKGYGFGLGTVYLVWIGLVLLLYPLCKAYDRYKTVNVATHRWLSYL